MGGSDSEGPRRMKTTVDNVSELVSVRAQCHTLDQQSIPTEARAWTASEPLCQRPEAPGCVI